MDMQNGRNKDENLEAPPKLVAALRQLRPEPVFVPPTVNEALLRAARQQLGRPEKRRPNWFRLMPWTVATAGLAAAALLTYPHAKEFLGSESSPGTKAFQRGSESTAKSSVASQRQALANVREDINRDGKVDILDAFLLARKLQGALFSDPNFDANGDGVVDNRDVEVIASDAVSLEKRGRS